MEGETSKETKLVVGKVSFSPDYESIRIGDVFGHNKLVFRNYKKDIVGRKNVIIPHDWSEQILGLINSCYLEDGNVDEWKPIIEWVFNKYPDLKEEFPGLVSRE